MHSIQKTKESIEENKQIFDRFKGIHDKILKYVISKNGQLVQQQNFQSDFILTNTSEIFTDLKYYISCMLVGTSYIRIIVQIKLKPLWEKIKYFGICNIIQLIKKKNQTEKSCLVYEFYEEKMSLRVRMQSMGSEISEYFFKLTIETIEILNKILNQIISQQIQKQKSMKNKSEIIINGIEELKVENQGSTPIFKNSVSELKRKNLGKRLEQFDSLVIKYKQTLFSEFKKFPKILRCIKEISITKDAKWKKSDGSQSLVSKWLATVTINDFLSIHVGTNLMLTKKNQECKQQNSTSSSSSNLQKQIDNGGVKQQLLQKNIEQKTVNIILIKKEPDREKRQVFEAQKKILAYLRNLTCPSVNNYYCVQKEQLKDIEYIYSDYYENKISSLLKPKKLIKIILGLSQALLFFHQNSIAHRDLKPDNILRTKDDQVKIIDFGSGCHTMSYLRRRTRNSQELVQQQLLTNREYNLTYSDLSIEVKQKIVRQNFEKHNYFDLYAFGKIIHNFVKNEQFKTEMGAYCWQCFVHLSRICMQQYPNDRPDPQNIYAFLKQLSPYF